MKRIPGTYEDLYDQLAEIEGEVRSIIAMAQDIRDPIARVTLAGRARDLGRLAGYLVDTFEILTGSE